MSEAGQPPKEPVAQFDGFEWLPFRVGTPVARWYSMLEQQTPEAKGFHRWTKQIAGRLWRTVNIIAASPTFLVLFATLPLVIAADRVSRWGRIGRWMQWVFLAPVCVAVVLSMALGWSAALIVVWKLVTRDDFRIGYFEVFKLLAGTNVQLGGTVVAFALGRLVCEWMQVRSGGLDVVEWLWDYIAMAVGIIVFIALSLCLMFAMSSLGIRSLITEM